MPFIPHIITRRTMIAQRRCYQNKASGRMYKTLEWSHFTEITGDLSILSISVRTTATFDLGSSLRASWTTDGQSQGPDTLAAALEGVLALHRRLEDLRLQQTNGHNIKEIE